jgi:hypothetical protein
MKTRVAAAQSWMVGRALRARRGESAPSSRLSRTGRSNRAAFSIQRGYLLLECLVYMTAVVVIMTVAMKGFYHCWNDNKALRRNADDIIRALHAGEQWRADLRAATEPMQPSRVRDAEQLRIPSAKGPIVYTYANGALSRQTASPATTHLLFTNLHSSLMQPDPARRVAAWTWELELNPTRKDAKVCPRFTFETVAGPVKSQ